MDNSLIELLLVFLLLAAILSFVLIVRISSIVREQPEPEDLPFTLPLDQPVPRFVGKSLQDDRMVIADFTAGSGSVVVFLSSACGDCQKKLPQLIELLPAMLAAEITFQVVAMESAARIKKFLGDTPLSDHVIMLDKATKRRLNPKLSTPFYLFIDDQGIAKASNFVGDENWQHFVGQMNDMTEPTR